MNENKPEKRKGAAVMLLKLSYLALVALVLWSIWYLLRRIVRSFRRDGGCGCADCGGDCSCCGQKEHGS